MRHEWRDRSHQGGLVRFGNDLACADSRDERAAHDLLQHPLARRVHALVSCQCIARLKLVVARREIFELGVDLLLGSPVATIGGETMMERS